MQCRQFIYRTDTQAKVWQKSHDKHSLIVYLWGCVCSNSRMNSTWERWERTGRHLLFPQSRWDAEKESHQICSADMAGTLPSACPYSETTEKKAGKRKVSQNVLFWLEWKYHFHFLNYLGHLSSGCISTFCLFMFFGSLSNICVIDQPAEERRDLRPDVQLFLRKHTSQYQIY